MRLLPLSLLLACACSRAPFPVDTNGANFPPLTVGDELKPGGVAIVDGDYTWTVLAPPTIGPETYRIAYVAPNDVWFVGNGLRHWDGQALSESLAPRPSVDFFNNQATAVPFALSDVAVVSPTDIWACGSHLFHWDGTAWTDHTAELSPRHAQFQCGLAATAERLFAVVDGAWMVRDGDTAWRKLNDFYYQQGTATRLDLNASNNRGGEHCVELGPSGELLVFGAGQLTEIHDPSPSPQSPVPPDRVEVTPGLRNLLRCHPMARVGNTFHSARYDSGGEEGLTFLTATFPGDFQPIATLSSLSGLMGNNNNASPLVGLAVHSSRTLVLVRGYDALAHRLTFLVEATGSTARLLPDRLFGWEGAAITFDGDTVLVAAQGGSILKGVRR